MELYLQYPVCLHDVHRDNFIYSKRQKRFGHNRNAFWSTHKCVCVCVRVSVLRAWTAVTNKLALFEMECGSRHFPKPAGSISRIETALLSISSGVELRTQYEYVTVNRPKRYLSAFFFCCGIFHMFSLRVKNHTVRTPNKSLKMCHCLSPSVGHLQLDCFT